MKIQESAENYLETIWMLYLRHGQVRSIDVANALGFSKPSVSYAMKKFRGNGLVCMDQHGFITLTDKGRAIAERTYERHKLLTDYFISLGVTPEVAREDACRAEHVLSEETYEKLKSRIEQEMKR
ncbi:MAG TPA: metal-dependent transcriptional regulator [Clostridiales bacterium]|jgi:Mn-dependent DtxR family transcriptional regulator|nr:metal-dependent transcriptional regulator [Clostridiales bacterium]